MPRTILCAGVLLSLGCAASTRQLESDGQDCRTLYGDAATPETTAEPAWCGGDPLWQASRWAFSPPLPPIPGVCAVERGVQGGDAGTTRWTFDRDGQPQSGVRRGERVVIERRDGLVRSVRVGEKRWRLDEAGRVIRYEGPGALSGARVHTMRYDAGALVELTLAQDRRWQLDPASGRPIRQERWEDGRWTLDYTVERLEGGFALTRGDGTRRLLRCDALGRAVPDGGVLDAAGRLVEAPHAGRPDPDQAFGHTLAYDAEGRLACEQRWYARPEIMFQFPPGRPGSLPLCAGACHFSVGSDILVDPLSSFGARTHFAYDADGRLASMALDIDADGTVDHILDLATTRAPDGAWRRTQRMGLWHIETETWYFDCSELPPAGER